MKFLCVCERGSSRSVALAWVLKDHLHHEAIAVGIKTISAATLEMLATWADVIVVVDRQYASDIPEAHGGKLYVWNVGADRYFRGFDTLLLNRYAEYLERDGFGPCPRYLDRGTHVQVQWAEAATTPEVETTNHVRS